MKLYKKKMRPTVAQFQELVLLEKEDALRGIDKEVRFCAIMMGLSIQEAQETLSMDQIMEINRRFVRPSFDDTRVRLPRRVWIKGRLFKVCPDFTALSFGEFVAFEHFVRTPDTATREMHHIMALLTREIKPPYIWPGRKRSEIKPSINPDRLEQEAAKTYLERARFMQEWAPADLGLDMSAFFLQVWRELCSHISSKNPGVRWMKLRGSQSRS
jgi:hypothetical protein